MSTTVEERLAQRPPSVAAMFLEQVGASGPREAFRYLDGTRWVSLNWNQTKERAYELAAGLLALGLGVEDRVAIVAGTRIEWILADLGIMCAGAATTTVYPSTQHEDVAFILRDSQSKVVIAEDSTQVEKVLKHADDLPHLVKIVQISGRTNHESVLGWEDFIQLGRDHLGAQPDAVDEAVAQLRPDHLATLIYTSGTTGRPKGVRLSQDSWTYEGVSIEEYDIIAADDLQYLWLPMSHVFGKTLLAVQLRIGFATAVDGTIERIVDNLGQVHPTFMAGAPRIFEKVRSRVVLTASQGPKAKIFAWAFDVGHKTIPIRLAGKKPTGRLALQYALADRLVFSKIKARMGGRIKFFVSGSAPLSREVQEWFYAAGLLVLEGYGLTETSAATCVNNPRATRFGTVGPAVPGTKVRIAEDGEVLIQGPGVMQGYHNNPEATAEAIKDGWLYSGDIGELDDAGYLRITDRKKDLIKTSGGKYVAPQKVEGALKTVCPYISQVVAHGDGRKYVTALIALDPDAISTWAEQNDQDIQDLAGNEAVRTMIQGYVDQANQQLERWETIKKFALLPTELSLDEGEVTPNMKIRRRVVENRYRETLDALYRE